MNKENDLRFNGSGCRDNTAYKAIMSADRKPGKVEKTIKTIKSVCDLADMELINATIKCKKTGKVWRG